MTSEKTDDDDDKIQKVFRNRLEKTGVALTAAQLSQALKKKGVGLADLHRVVRERNPADAAKFSRYDRRGAGDFQTIGDLRPGVYFIDYAEFHKTWAGSNKGATGFLVAVENLTNHLFASPTQGKDTRQWLESIEKFVELTRNVRTIYSDRDAVATSAKFRDRIRERYGCEWHFLRKGNKSYLAERYIGFLKTKLSVALLAAGPRSSGEPEKKWIDYLPVICKEYNTSKVPGTSYTRQGILRENFYHFASQLLGEKRGETGVLDRINSFKAGPFENERWNRKIFKLKPGDRVLLAREADWKHHGGAGGFAKPSLRGSYGDRVYTVAGRQLRANKAYTKFVPVYSLEELGPAGFNFYEHELLLVRADDDADKKKT